ncbi:MAG: GNAT family N-acetyltransferase [Pelagimonas sp.]|jgi:GNAT superfamily N-acetyltransferase|nr:GNAT family N-acetyltransferase [Pelagimonas sp.]
MIDTLTPDDIPALAQMLRGLNRLHMFHLPHLYHDNGADEALEAFFTTQFEQGARVIGYRLEGIPRGYLMWQLQERPADGLMFARKRGLLDHIFVDPILRKRGVGRRLIAAFEEQIQQEGCGSWVSLVHAFNTPSQQLMQDAGAGVAVQMFEKRF